MATVNFTVLGNYSAVQGNSVKVQVVTSTDAWSVLSTATLGVTSNIIQSVVDQDGNYYVGINSSVYKYGPNLTADTTWGSSGKVVITGLFTGGGQERQLAINQDYTLFAISILTAASSAINCWAFSSAGTSVWAASTITISSAPVSIGITYNGNVILGGSSNSTIGIREYSKAAGTLVETYPAISMTFHYALCVNSSNDIFTGGQNAGGFPLGRGYMFESAATVATWSLTTQRYFMQAVVNSAYVFCNAQHTASVDAPFLVINKSTGIVTAQTLLSGLNFCERLALTTVPNIVVVADKTAYSFYILDETATVLAQNTTRAVISIQPMALAGRAALGFDIILADKFYSKYLVAFANNKVYWESAVSTMTEITAARNDIATDDPLSAAAGLQKIFIANTSTLRIADFANIKLSTSQIGAAGVSAPAKGLTLTGGTSGAKMIADFCPASTGSAAVYGYQTTAASFVSNDTVTGGASSSVSFALISTAVSAPHWYTWTPQFNDTTNYGSMPASAKLCTLYRGRIVVSGNPQYPHQWYMSKVLDPFDWLYAVNNPLTAVRGGNADAGEIGDIIKALIPYQDDYLIFGCANSMWLLRGDPASGGSIDPIIETTGIFGAKAWCFDDNNNLYFFGQNGLYKTTVGQFMAQSLSELALPEWVKDWALDESLHRIVLTFDPFRRGIIVSKTTLASGVNENYWYDFKTQGFFLETYPSDCGVFCSHFYNAANNASRKLLLGGADGYIREFDDATKDDVTSTSTAVAIESYMVCPIVPIAEEPAQDAKVKSLTVINAGGASGGTFSDTDSVDLKLYVGDSAETVLEDIRDAASAMLSISLISAGRQTKIGMNLRGSYLGVKASNTAVSESWGLERIWGDARPAGRNR